MKRQSIRRELSSAILGAIGLITVVIATPIIPVKAAAAAATTTTPQRTSLSVNPLGALQRVPMDCNGQHYVGVLPPHGEGMPLAALEGLATTPSGPALQRQLQLLQSPSVLWMPPICKQGHGGSPERVTTTHAQGVTSGPSSTGVSANWAGYTTSGYSAGTWEESVAYWNIPSTFPNPPGQTYSSTWAGLGTGDSNNDALLQTGSETDVNTNGFATNYLWWELYPMNAQQEFDVRVYPGDSIYGDVIHTGYGTGYAYACDESYSPAVCSMVNITWPSSYTVTGAQAEWIAERTEIGSNYPLFTDLNGIQFSGTSAMTSSGQWWSLQNMNLQTIDMSSTCAGQPPYIAVPGSIYNQESWGLNWYGYGQVVYHC